MRGATMSDELADEVSENSKVEIAKALLAVQSIAAPDAFQQIRTILVPQGANDAVDNALKGLSEEDEFSMLCKLMETTTHLVHMEQRPVIDGDYLIPDFLARFQPGCIPHGKTREESRGVQCFVEVKSTKNNVFKIGGHKLRRLRAFADQFGLPLFIAVRFLRFDEYALWVIVEDEDRSKTSLRVTYQSLLSGSRHVLWDDTFIMVHPWIHFRAVHDTAGNREEGSLHEKYGVLTNFDIIFDLEQKIEGTGVVDNQMRFTKIDAMTFAAFFEAFRPAPLTTKQKGTKTYEILSPTVPCTITDLVYLHNRLARDAEGRTLFNPSRVLSGGDDERILFTRTMIENLMRYLGPTVFGWVGFGDPEEHLRKWRRYGGVS
jgi:hypothetical protein